MIKEKIYEIQIRLIDLIGNYPGPMTNYLRSEYNLKMKEK